MENLEKNLTDSAKSFAENKAIEYLRSHDTTFVLNVEEIYARIVYMRDVVETDIVSISYCLNMKKSVVMKVMELHDKHYSL